MNDGIPARGLRSASELFADKPHGTRGRYLAGCKCFHCRRANSDYFRERKHAQEAGDWNGIVSARRARKHIEYLSSCGVGRRMVVELSGVGKTCICQIKSGKKTNVRARTERQILSVEPLLDNAAPGAIVDASKTWERIREIQLRGYSKSQIAKLLGYVGHGIQIKKTNCSARRAREVRDLWLRICQIQV